MFSQVISVHQTQSARLIEKYERHEELVKAGVKEIEDCIAGESRHSLPEFAKCLQFFC